jgi:dUTP pyrophosphatase
LALTHGVTVLNTPGTIDSDYRGEVKAILVNHGQTSFRIARGMKIAQLVVARHERVLLEEVSELSGSTRGSGGFGSTGLSASKSV